MGRPGSTTPVRHAKYVGNARETTSLSLHCPALKPSTGGASLGAEPPGTTRNHPGTTLNPPRNYRGTTLEPPRSPSGTPLGQARSEHVESMRLPRDGGNYCPGLEKKPVLDDKNAAFFFNGLCLRVLRGLSSAALEGWTIKKRNVCLNCLFCVCYGSSPVRPSKVASQNPRRARRAVHKILEHEAVRDTSCFVQSPTPELRFPFFNFKRRLQHHIFE